MPKESVNMAILVRLAEAMAGAGNIKQNELAERSGIDPGTIGRYYNHDLHGITLDKLSSLCKALNVKPGDLLELVEDNDPRLKQRKQVVAERRVRRSVNKAHRSGQLLDFTPDKSSITAQQAQVQGADEQIGMKGVKRAE
jgi:DNA-binding Xre family transcriptional regulator